MIKVFRTHVFMHQLKRLQPNEHLELENAISELILNPEIGHLKKNNLAGIRVFKFKMVHHLTLLAYSFSKEEEKIILFSLGSHENFYRDLIIDSTIDLS
jgi:hypothetical protein